MKSMHDKIAGLIEIEQQQAQLITELRKKGVERVKEAFERIDEKRFLLQQLLKFDEQVKKATIGQPIVTNFGRVRERLFGEGSLRKIEARYTCKGIAARHIGRYGKKFTCVQANEKYFNIYREDYSKVDPYQTIEMDKTLLLSIEFHGLWILAGNDETSGSLIILKPVYNEDAIDFQFEKTFQDE